MEPLLAEIRMFSGNFAPKGWAICNGQLLPINQNQALFSLLGTTYGGNGTTTFALPNMQGRIPISMTTTNGSVILGEAAGNSTHTMTTAEMPTHTHYAMATALKAQNGASNGVQSGSPQNNYPGNSGADNSYINAAGANEFFASDALQVNVGVTGQTQPFNNMMPSLCVTFIIALQGVYPSRG